MTFIEKLFGEQHYKCLLCGSAVVGHEGKRQHDDECYFLTQRAPEALLLELIEEKEAEDPNRLIPTL